MPRRLIPRGLAAEPLLVDLLGFARGRAAGAALLVLAGALLEMAGVLMLVPIVRILLGGDGPGAGLLGAMRAVGLGTPRAQVTAALIAFAVLVALRFVVLLRRDVMVARLREDFVTAIRARAFRALARAPWADLAGRGHGRIGHALARDVDRVSDTVGVAIAGALAVVQIAVQLAIALALAPLITAGVVALGAAAYAALRGLRRRALRHGGLLTEADFELFETAATYLRGLKPARAHGLEAAYAASFERAARRLASERVRQDRDYSLSRLAIQSLAALVGLGAIVAGIFLVPVGPERLIVVLVILARLSIPFQLVQVGAQHVGYAAAAYRSLIALTGEIARAPAAPSPSAEPLDRAPGLRFRDVGYASAGAELLSAIDCEVPAGRVTALTGPSGAGKSLFCDLAVGLLTPESGRIELDGRPLDLALVARLARSLAYVGQEPFVLEDTLRANLTWGCGPVPEEEIWRALEAVGAAGLARGLRGGLDGSVRAGGSRFSGGERQRFRLAHALLRRPRMMVLDEATNALDLDAETAVLAGIRRAAPQATILMVTHRPSTLAIADHLLVIEGGRLVHAGDPAGIGADDPARARLRLAGD